MRGRRRGYLLLKGSSRGSLRQPLWRSIFGVKNTEIGVLLAYLEKGCPPICTKVRQMPTILSYPKTTIARFDHGLYPLALLEVDNDNNKVRSLCEELGIKKHFSTPHHPQANGQVEAVNNIIKHVLKMKLDVSKGAWVDELPQVLWAIRNTTRTPIGKTAFLMALGTEAMTPSRSDFLY
ncbi:uncharacterized protein LOC111376559 [Olea europaea var. sylvestris]|uniref:uncharacterized protein LOC111376559 n=1 Tax=Olea europaea var. sylvestris TaxID=158386 RepID=UPI000C1D2317|nr:uncharacterized protein LOC111376559 [Olea europaea var. sylvestris]